jgi:Ser/Thr protein kinase RdoA (MazF antagonist)
MTDPELRERLEAALAAQSDGSARIAHLNRRPSEYCTSFTVEELDVTLDDGTKLQVVYKQLHPDSMLQTARNVKPPFLLDPRREIEAYRGVLQPAACDAALFYGAIEQPEAHRFGVFLERIAGTHLWQVGDFAAWEHAARWLAALHCGPATAAAGRCSHLLRYDRNFHRQWLNRAYRFVLRDPSRGDADHSAIRQIARIYERVVDHLCALPQVFIHGDYHPSNILCASPDHRIRPIDWELAGVGPAVIDLAAVTAGNWSAHERDRMINAYRRALPDKIRHATPSEGLTRSVEYARLYWAVRWLGWSDRWTPPRPHARDWLAEARDASARLGLNLDVDLAPQFGSPA